MQEPIEILYNNYLETFGGDLTQDEFSTKVKNDGQFVTEVVERLYDYNTEVTEAIDILFTGGGGGVQKGNTTYEDIEVKEDINQEEEEKAREEWEPSEFNSDGSVDTDYYDNLPMMDRDYQPYQDWKNSQTEKIDKADLSEVAEITSVNSGMPIQKDQVATIVTKELKALEPILAKKAAEDAERFSEQEETLEEEAFDVGFFSPYEAKGQGLFRNDEIGIEGFRLTFEDKLPEGFRIWTPDNSFNKLNNSVLNENLPQQVLDYQKRAKTDGNNFIFVQAPDGKVHEIKSLKPNSKTKPKDSQKDFLKFISPYLDSDGKDLLSIKTSVLEVEKNVEKLFKDADIDLVQKQKINKFTGLEEDGSGELGLSRTERLKIRSEVSDMSFNLVTKSSENMDGERTEYLFRPHEDKLQAALETIKNRDNANRVEREEPLTLDSKEVQDLVRKEFIVERERKAKNRKWQSWVDGDIKLSSKLEEEVVKTFSNVGKDKAAFAAEKAEYLATISQKQVTNYLTYGTGNINELNNFINNPTIVYNILPGQTAVQLKDGRVLPKELIDNAEKERLILSAKIETSRDSQDLFYKKVDKMNNADDQWNLVKRNYNDAAKFATQFAMNSADLIFSVGYAAKKLVSFLNPAEIMLNAMGVEDPLDNWMISWNNYKSEVSEGLAEDVAFGEIDDFQDVTQYALQSIASQLPIILSMMATGGASMALGRAAGLGAKGLTRLSTISSSTFVGLSSFGGKVADMNYEEFTTGKDLYSDAEIILKGLMYGVVEGGLAAVSTAPLLNKGVAKYKGFGGTTKAVVDESKALGRAAFARKFFTKEILPETLTEMGAEGLTTGLQNLIDGRPFLENMAETLVTSGIWGAGMSGSVGVVGLGQKNFANSKNLGIISKQQKLASKYQNKISTLINQKLELDSKGLPVDINLDAEIKKYLDLRDIAQNKVNEAVNQTEINIKKKGIKKQRYVKNFVDSQVAMADLRNTAESIVNDKTLSNTEKEQQLSDLNNTYRSIEFYQESFKDSKTFGDGFSALAAAAQNSLPFSKVRKEYNKLKQEAIDSLTKKNTDQDYNPSKKEITAEASAIFYKNEIKENIARDKAISTKLNLGFKDFQTQAEANLFIKKEYNKLIKQAEKDGNTERVEFLKGERSTITSKISKGSLNGFNDMSLKTSVVVVENMKNNEITTTGLHEITHGITNEFLVGDKYKGSFDKMANQIVHYLQYTNQSAILNKMALDNSNLLNKDGSYNNSELISSFMEAVSDEKIDLEKMDNQIAVLGKLFNSGLATASKNSFGVDFSGETEILQYFVGLGKALKKGDLGSLNNKITEFKNKMEAEAKANAKDGKVIELNPKQLEQRARASETLYEKTSTIMDSDATLKDKGFAVGEIWKNEIRSRLINGYKLGGQFLKPSTWNGWSGEVMQDVIQDMTTGGSGIPGLVKSWENRSSKDQNISLPAWINNRLNQRLTGYLPNDLVSTTTSIDSETARQIEDVKAGNFDEAIDTKNDKGRELKTVEELKIITPELVVEIKDIIIKTLKRTAITKGISKETALSDIKTAIEKEMTKVIKNKMGPITRSVLGFAPKQYVDFIKEEMNTIIGSMPTSVIKQKAKSKAWAEIFQLTEIGREDIKKVDPDGKVTNYRKQIFKLEKPNAQKFQKYFTRAGYTTLIERQRSLIKPMAQQLTVSELARLRKDNDFIKDLVDRTGMTELQVSELFIDSSINDIQSELDNTASEILSQDNVKFSDTLAASDAQSRQTFIDGLKNPTFRKMLADNIANSKYLNNKGKTSAVRVTIEEYFTDSEFSDLTTKDISQIARDFGGLNKLVFQKQFAAESKILNEEQLANLIAESIESKIENQADYKEIELALKILNVDFDPRSLTSVNQGRAMALKLAKLVGREKFIRLFAPGLAGPGGLGGLMVTQPKGNQITESEMVGLLPKKGEIGGKAVQKQNSNIITYSGTKSQVDTMSKLLNFRNIEFTTKNGKLIIPEISGSSKNANISTISKYAREGGRQGSGLYLNKPDLEQNVIYAKDEKGNFIVGPSKGDYGTVTNKGRYDNRATSKNWFKSKKFQDLSNSGKLKEMNDIKDVGDVNKRLFRETVMDLAGKLTPTEARWFVHVNSADMTGGIKASASLIGIPYLNPADLAKALNLSPNDVYVLEHMTPAKYMALLTYKFLLDPSGANATKFNVELDNFNTIILPKGVDDILFFEGLGSDMGLKHEVGKDPFETRYKEILKTMQILKTDGEVIGNFTSRYSETNNNPKTQEFNSNLVNSSKVMNSETNQNSGISVIEAEILDKALAIARDPNAPVKKIRVFDFDDTLARSDSKVFAIKGDERIEMSAEKFANEGASMLENGFTFDFSDFNVVKDGKPGPMLEVAKKIQNARGTEDLFVLTARAPESQPAIKQFLESVGLDVPLENITGLGKSSEFAKSSWIVNKAAEGYNDFYFTDDAIQNVEAVERALDVIDVKSQVQQAKVKFSETVDQTMNDIIYQKTGIESFKEYSDVRAKSEGRDKRSFDLIPASAEDFGGLLYNLLGKGKEGDAQWAWMQENLIKPYNRGVNDLTVAQNTLAADFKALKEGLEGIPKNLQKKAFGGFTFEDIVRINAWTQQGIEVEGLSKRDLKEINSFVKENPEIELFSNQLVNISKSNGYHYPGKNWLAGTITTDMREGLRTDGRTKYLAQWNENIDQAFSNKNLNKLEAAFGPKYREALEDSIRRMKTGTNRGVAMGRIETRFLDYINNSIGGVMFLNSRSAILQTISSLNFIELTGDNNLLNAGKAFANQPQYWSDFMTLMNSDYLVDRRNGLKINVSESEIAEAAKTSTNKAKAVIATLLKKGFVLTQVADSFAIATGGASYYRNKVNSYLKQGLSEVEAQALAFEDFKAKSEESQQSSDPSKISQQQASTAGKTILAFANTPSQYSRIMKKAALDIVNGRGDWKNNLGKIVYYGALQNIIFTTLQSALFAIAFSDDEEDESFLTKYKGAKTINSMTDNILRGLGIGGAVVSTLKNIAIDIYDRSQKSRPEYADVAFKLLDISPPVDIKVSKFRQGMTTWEYGRKDPEAKDPFDINNPAYEAAAKVVASTTNVPVDRLYQKVENVKGALDDENANWKRIAMILGWPEWQLDSKKETEQKRKEEKKKRKEANTRRYAYKPVLDEEGYKKQKIKEDTEKYFKLRKPEQVRKLDSLGLTPSEIRSLKYEKDRVNKLLELMK